MLPERTDDPYRDYLAREVKFSEERVAEQARSIGRRMTRLADQLDKGVAHVNGLGELQGSGSMLDAACAKYDAVLQVLRDYNAFKEAEE
jgi:hypothetical protein